MTLSEYIGLIALGLPVGFLMLGVFKGREREKTCQSVARWCLTFGGLSVGLVGIAVFSHAEPSPTKGVLGMLFIGLPAFPVGLMLRFFSGSDRAVAQEDDNTQVK